MALPMAAGLSWPSAVISELFVSPLLLLASNAKMALPETGLAIIPAAGGTQRLARIVGPALAKKMILLGDVIDGKQAADAGATATNLLGLAQEMCTDDSAFEKARELADQIVLRGICAIFFRAARHQGCEKSHRRVILHVPVATNCTF